MSKTDDKQFQTQAQDLSPLLLVHFIFYFLSIYFDICTAPTFNQVQNIIRAEKFQKRAKQALAVWCVKATLLETAAITPRENPPWGNPSVVGKGQDPNLGGRMWSGVRVSVIFFKLS